MCLLDFKELLHTYNAFDHRREHELTGKRKLLVQMLLARPLYRCTPPVTIIRDGVLTLAVRKYRRTIVSRPLKRLRQADSNECPRIIVNVLAAFHSDLSTGDYRITLQAQVRGVRITTAVQEARVVKVAMKD